MLFENIDPMLLEPLAEDIKRGHHARTVVSMMNQMKIAQENQRPHRISEFGQLEARIDQNTFFRMQEKWGHDCWYDDEFYEHTLRTNPDIRVNSQKKVTIIRP